MENNTIKINSLKEKLMKIVFAISATMSILALITICFFLFSQGFPTIAEIGVGNFLGGSVWNPSKEIFGILPMIVGSIYVTAGAIVIGVPIGIVVAVYLAKYASEKAYSVLKPCVELMAGIPSIVYGFFGMATIVPLVRNIGGSGKSVLSASILLGIMILPTIINVSETALKALPDSYYEGALALGATKERSVFFTMIPAAKSGILASVILGIGRAIGETMAVIMVAGNAAIMPSLLEKVRTMTTNIVMEISYAEVGSLHERALISTGVVLFVFILIINVSFSLLKKESK